MAPMEPKRHHALHLRPPHLLPRPRIQTQQIAPSPIPIQHHAQANALVLLRPRRIPHEDRLAGTLRLPDARHGRLGLGVEFEEAVEEGRVAAVRNAEDVARGLGRVVRVEGREFGAGEAGGGEERGDGLRFGGGDGEGAGAGDGGDKEAGEGRFAGRALAVYVVEGARGGALHVVVVEALEDVEVGIGGDVGDDVAFSGVGVRGPFPGVDGVEGEEGVGFVDADQALAVFAVDDEPEVLFAGVECHGVE